MNFFFFVSHWNRFDQIDALRNWKAHRVSAFEAEHSKRRVAFVSICGRKRQNQQEVDILQNVQLRSVKVLPKCMRTTIPLGECLISTFKNNSIALGIASLNDEFWVMWLRCFSLQEERLFYPVIRAVVMLGVALFRTAVSCSTLLPSTDLSIEGTWSIK